MVPHRHRGACAGLMLIIRTFGVHYLPKLQDFTAHHKTARLADGNLHLAQQSCTGHPDRGLCVPPVIWAYHHSLKCNTQDMIQAHLPMEHNCGNVPRMHFTLRKGCHDRQLCYLSLLDNSLIGCAQWTMPSSGCLGLSQRASCSQELWAARSSPACIQLR